jgi:phosphatidylglycerol:prolipoprotein diacylglycerol transferase
MHPVLFNIGDHFTVYSYGFFIVIGALVAVSYLSWQGKKKFNLSFDKINSLFLILLLAAIVGGKFFLFFEKPSYYIHNLSALISGRGFVFYGSLLFCIPTMLYFFKKNKLPIRPMLDLMAIVTLIVHFFGRIGCFLAGCCYGIEWHGPLSVMFTDEACLAPLNTPLHPTQLYSAAMILLILIILLILKSFQKFDGQIFLSYLILYAIGRSILETFRGDLSRGFVIEGYLSNSQFISGLIILITGYFYYTYWKKSKTSIRK